MHMLSSVAERWSQFTGPGLDGGQSLLNTIEYRHLAKIIVASSLIWSHGEVAAQKNNNPADTMVSGA